MILEVEERDKELHHIPAELRTCQTAMRRCCCQPRSDDEGGDGA